MSDALTDAELDALHGQLLTPLYGGFTTDVWRLVAEVRRLRAENAKLRKMNEWRAAIPWQDDAAQINDARGDTDE